MRLQKQKKRATPEAREDGAAHARRWRPHCVAKRAFPFRFGIKLFSAYSCNNMLLPKEALFAGSDRWKKSVQAGFLDSS